MDKRLGDWANCAEIVSGIAVVLTLVFLVVGIHENTEIARATAYDSHLSSINDIRKTLVEDRELMLAWQVYRRGEADQLNEIDRIRIEYQVNIQWAVYEKAWFGYRYGIIGDAEWVRFERLVCLNYDVLTANAMQPTVTAQLTAEFIDYVDAVCVR